VLYAILLYVLQVSALDEATAHSPGWIKADGCDVNKVLKESAKLQWSGDVDLSDRSLQQQYDKYKQRLKRAGPIGLHKESMVKNLNFLLWKKLAEFMKSGEKEQNNINAYDLFSQI